VVPFSVPVLIAGYVGFVADLREAVVVAAVVGEDFTWLAGLVQAELFGAVPVERKIFTELSAALFEGGTFEGNVAAFVVDVVNGSVV
ncbi:hypothetical protein MNBD_GAMMA16-712, partial [hydrothermal vent metagenome]